MTALVLNLPPEYEYAPAGACLLVKRADGAVRCVTLEGIRSAADPEAYVRAEFGAGAS